MILSYDSKLTKSHEYNSNQKTQFNYFMCLWFAWKYPMGVCSNLLMCCVQSLQSCPTLCDPRDCSPQAPLSVGFSRHEYWSGLPFPSPGHLPHPGIEPGSLTCPALAGGFFTTSATWEVQSHLRTLQNIKKPLGLVLSPFLFFKWNPKTELCKRPFYWLLLM